MHAKKTWVVIMDGARGQIFDLVLPDGTLSPHEDGTFTGSRLLTRDVGTDRPGHGHASVGSARHAFEPRTDMHENAEAAFAASIAERLAQASERRLYDQLIIIAAPKSLGDLRKALPAELREKKVRLEITGDWTKLSPIEAAWHLVPHLVEIGMIEEDRS